MTSTGGPSHIYIQLGREDESKHTSAFYDYIRILDENVYLRFDDLDLWSDSEDDFPRVLNLPLDGSPHFIAFLDFV